jgi:HEAT repeat protein
MKSLTHQLGSQRFAERKAAERKLKEVGKAALPALEGLLKHEPSIDLRQRAQKLIEEIPIASLPGSGDVQWVRALEVLENINTPEARELLKSLAQGRADAGLTRDAKAVLARLSVAR